MAVVPQLVKFPALCETGKLMPLMLCLKEPDTGSDAEVHEIQSALVTGMPF
jgi:hypothetical protein